MSLTKKNVARHGHPVPGAPATRKSHLRRFWWVYLLVFIIVAVVVVVPSVLLVAVPRLAQQKLNKAKLTIDAISITQTQTDSFLMAINSTVDADSSVHATLDPFEGTLYLADANPPQAFAKVNFPQTTSSSMQVVNVSQNIPIQDLGSFTAFNKALLSSQSVNVQIKGDTHIHVRGISRSYPATFDKTVNLKGLNNFVGISISDAQISPLATKKNFNATVHIPNPSILTLDIGNTTFTNFLDGEDIGLVYLNNLVLRPGINTFPTTADIKQLPILNALTLEPNCELNGKLPFQLSGQNVLNNGQVVPYFRDALAANILNVTVDLSEAAKEKGVPVGCIKNLIS
ncbi:hypothetical protein GGS21DRAFT_69249 [Xylaria nigripes]|nr:hypothetical protein GGS21DRAFT_69249 [Xylaria nigripes]